MWIFDFKFLISFEVVDLPFDVVFCYIIHHLFGFITSFICSLLILLIDHIILVIKSLLIMILIHGKVSVHFGEIM